MCIPESRSAVMFEYAKQYHWLEHKEVSLKKLLFTSSYLRLQKKSYKSPSTYFKRQIKMFFYFQKWDIDRGKNAFR